MTLDEVLRWGTSLLTLCGFGLAMGLNPALYAATGDVLARNVDVSKRLAWMLLGLAVGTTTLLLVFRSFDPTTRDQVPREPRRGAPQPDDRPRRRHHLPGLRRGGACLACAHPGIS
ncbi:hypothetical protein ACFPRL_11545 [Pseudoclavibacter helvolus]